MSRFRNIKIRVGDPETSRKVQEKLFEDGCWWDSDRSGPQFIGMPFIYAYENGKFSWCRDEDRFANHWLKELTPAEILGDDAEWDGEGLPPVGCECEARYKNADSAEWFFLRVLAIDCGHLFGWAGKDPCAIDSSEYELRPISTEEEKRRANDAESIWAAIDEVEKMMVDAGFTRGGDKKKAP